MRLHALPVTKLPSVSRTRAAISRRAASSSTFTRRSAPKFTKDFDHHAPGIARLNHGSFGATPAPVLAATEAYRARWLAQPDDEYFSGALDADLQAATAAAADAIGAPAAETALVENATVAAAIVFRRWSQLDGTVLQALAMNDTETLQSLPVQKLNGGSSEIRNWICAAGALEELPLAWSDYQPGYRTPAGTGTGLGFAIWSESFVE